MTQLSATSTAILQRTERALIILERVIKVVRQFVVERCPLYASNVVTAVLLLKDLAGFLPSYIYKLVLAIVIYSIAYRKLKKWRRLRISQEKQPVKQSNLQNLSPDFQVRNNPINSLQLDSLSLQLMIEQPQPRQFRDIVFFDLMRSYRESPQ